MAERLKPEIAQEILTCTKCNGHIPEGDRYWKRGQIANEHTNCELYTTEYLRKNHLKKETT